MLIHFEKFLDGWYYACTQFQADRIFRNFRFNFKNISAIQDYLTAHNIANIKVTKHTVGDTEPCVLAQRNIVTSFDNRYDRHTIGVKFDKQEDEAFFIVLTNDGLEI